MQQKDFQSITVTDVVREADINRGTFYAHYRDVYDLREKIEAEMIEDFRELIADLHPSGTSNLQPVLARAVDYLEENREIVRALVRGTGVEGFGRKMITCSRSAIWKCVRSEAWRTLMRRVFSRPASSA